LKVRFQADADLRRAIIKGLRRHEPGIDFKAAHDASLDGLDDLTVLAVAASEGRLLVSHDVSTRPHALASSFFPKPRPLGLGGEW
jgi:hypothetical protein